MKASDKIDQGKNIYKEIAQALRNEGLDVAPNLLPDQALGLRVDIESGNVWVGGQLIEPPLTNAEFRLLSFLYKNAGKICGKYETVKSVWGEEYIDEVDDFRIAKLVSRLRRRIEPDPSNPRFIQTVRGRGYKLVIEP